MSDRQYAVIFLRLGLSVSVLFAVFLGVWHLLGNQISAYANLKLTENTFLTIPISRWWDIPFVFLLVNTYPWILRVYYKFNWKSAEKDILISSLIVGLGIGFLIGLGVESIGLVTGLVAGLGISIAIGFVAGFDVGLGVGLGISLGIGFFTSFITSPGIALAIGFIAGIFTGIVAGLCFLIFFIRSLKISSKLVCDKK